MYVTSSYKQICILLTYSCPKTKLKKKKKKKMDLKNYRMSWKNIT
jgi:hypothetical protein